MSSAPMPVKGATTALTVVFLTASLWVLRGYVWPTLSNVEVGPLQALLDTSLFRNDFTVQESLRFTPRFYYNAIILLPARLGLPLVWSFAAWHLIALAAFVAAVRSIGATLQLGAIATGLLTVWLLSLNVGTLGGVFLYTNAPVPGVWAGALVMCGVAAALRGRGTAAFAWFGAAALLQFLVGFYAGMLALPALLPMNRRERMLALGAWGLGLALIYLPLWFSARADANALSNAAFVEIYAQLRHPHHLVPSTWPRILWERAVFFYVGGWYFLRSTSAGRPRIERIVLNTTLGMTAGALILNYVFIEVYPSAFVAKLQPARITPLAQAIMFGLIATRVQAALERGRHWLALLLGATPFSLYPGLVLGLAGVLGRPAEPSRKWNWPALILAGAVALSFRGLGGSLLQKLVVYRPYIALFAAQLVPHFLRVTRVGLTAVAGLAVAAAALTARASLQPDWAGHLSGRFAIDAAPFDPPAILGARFRISSNKDAVVLVPPTSEPWSFKLYAQRAVVVDDKNIPFTTAGLKEWHDRMQYILGTGFTRGIDAAAAWSAQKPETLRRLAAQYGARYILTRDQWHPVLPGRKIDTEAGWSLWDLTPESPARP